MTHSIAATMPPAGSSGLSFCSARRTVAPVSAETLIGGGRGSGMNAETASPATVLFSYRPGCRRVAIEGKDPCLVDDESKGSITKAWRKARFLYDPPGTRRGRLGGRRRYEREAVHRARKAGRWSRGALRAARRPA